MKESPIFSKLFDLVAWVIQVTMKFPREQRFVVASALQRSAMSAHEAAIRAELSLTPAVKAEALQAVGVQIALARFYVRLAARLYLITDAQYEFSSESLLEIGRLLHAWQRMQGTKQTVPSATVS